MHAATTYFRKFFSKQNLAGKLSGKESIPGYSKLRANFDFKRLIGLLTYNEAFSAPPYTGIGLETYFYCNYNDVCE
jgi:hypothetical protein